MIQLESFAPRTAVPVAEAPPPLTQADVDAAAAAAYSSGLADGRLEDAAALSDALAALATTLAEARAAQAAADTSWAADVLTVARAILAQIAPSGRDALLAERIEAVLASVLSARPTSTVTVHCPPEVAERIAAGAARGTVEIVVDPAARPPRVTSGPSVFVVDTDAVASAIADLLSEERVPT